MTLPSQNQLFPWFFLFPCHSQWHKSPSIIPHVYTVHSTFALFMTPPENQQRYYDYFHNCRRKNSISQKSCCFRHDSFPSICVFIQEQLFNDAIARIGACANTNPSENCSSREKKRLTKANGIYFIGFVRLIDRVSAKTELMKKPNIPMCVLQWSSLFCNGHRLIAFDCH